MSEHKVGDLRVSVTVEMYKGTNDRGYGRWETQATLGVDAGPHDAWRTFREALDMLRGPVVVVGIPATER